MQVMFMGPGVAMSKFLTEIMSTIWSTVISIMFMATIVTIMVRLHSWTLEGAFVFFGTGVLRNPSCRDSSGVGIPTR